MQSSFKCWTKAATFGNPELDSKHPLCMNCRSHGGSFNHVAHTQNSVWQIPALHQQPENETGSQYRESIQYTFLETFLTLFDSWMWEWTRNAQQRVTERGFKWKSLKPATWYTWYVLQHWDPIYCLKYTFQKVIMVKIRPSGVDREHKHSQEREYWISVHQVATLSEWITMLLHLCWIGKQAALC